MTLLENNTRMAARLELLDARSGHEVLTVIAKMTYEVSAHGEVSLPRRRSPVRRADVWRGSKSASSLRYPSDLEPEKPGTDVLLVGTAHPTTEGAREMDVGVRIDRAHAPLQKVARLYGPRLWEAGLASVVPGAPGLLAPTPLTYENAFGGVARRADGRTLVQADNPVGSGVASDRRELVGTLAPVLEDFLAPLSSRAPGVAGFGPIPSHWRPRLSFAGTHDDAWRRSRAPLAPLDQDARFFSCAPEGLWSEQPLRGDEPVSVVGVTPRGVWTYRLPLYPPLFRFVVRGDVKSVATHLDTYLIDADRGRVELTWRASVPVPRKVQAIERVMIEPLIELPERLAPDWAEGEEEDEDDDESREVEA